MKKYPGPKCEVKQKSNGYNWCTGEDVELVQLKSGHNVYQGKKVSMCKGCRKFHNGGFKIIYPE